MRKQLLPLVFTAVILASYTDVKAQYVLKEADEHYELFDYTMAIELYKKALDKKETFHATERLAECYRLTRSYAEAENWYAQVVAFPEHEAVHVFRYAELLQNNRKYAEAKEQYERYAAMPVETNEALLQARIASCDSALVWLDNPGPAEVTAKPELNTEYSDWGAVPYKDMLLFASDREAAEEVAETVSRRPFLRFDRGKSPNRKIYGWTGHKYYRLYQSAGGSVERFPIQANTDYHICAVSATAGGEELFFALTRLPEKLGKTKRGVPSTITIEIYSVKKEGENWSDPVPFRYNNGLNWSVSDPYISSDGQTLYFVSDMEGGLGGTDIYVCRRMDDGSWGEAENLGPEINTAADERTPALDQEGNLYFSSKGHAGMGGLDIFHASASGNSFASPRNMGYPVNSSHDDLTFRYFTEETGYLTSDRREGRGDDDIYYFTIKKVLHFALEGQVLTLRTKEPLAGAKVILTNLDTREEFTTRTDADGNYRFELAPDARYRVRAEMDEYQLHKAEDAFTAGLEASTTLERDLFLESLYPGQTFVLENIYYDFDKSNIREDAALELDKLVALLKEYPTISIELSSHTDSRGSDSYNMALSQRRAESAVAYLVEKGIAAERLEARGYGETRLVNKCSNGVACSVEAHQLNRRTEFTILKK
ncbi:WD40 repeat protein [Anseongella ginsenosidimutans]|uniref:WD40 repeat protein n=1 Tax=Anseongella ginsenosidimutans TaxID=496056 RepID=A0A4R3KKC5_9SPHI|nr:OmpA family protein [Anseongella ginsenosidimutans]TCS84331.1 WD40 repeat protein [Anseongella ginsenosidimutans]